MQNSVPRYVVYLLCAKPWPGKPVHYVGITTQSSFQRRIQDHFSGNGTTKTRNWYLAGYVIELVAVHLTDDPDDERRIQNIVNLPYFFCPTCENREYEHPEQERAKQQARIESRQLPNLQSFTKEKGHRPN